MDSDGELDARLELRLTSGELATLRVVARELGITCSKLVRDAVREFCADFTERRIFDRRRERRPVATERRASAGRRQYDRSAPSSVRGGTPRVE